MCWRGWRAGLMWARSREGSGGRGPFVAPHSIATGTFGESRRGRADELESRFFERRLPLALCVGGEDSDRAEPVRGVEAHQSIDLCTVAAGHTAAPPA